MDKLFSRSAQTGGAEHDANASVNVSASTEHKGAWVKNSSEIRSVDESLNGHLVRLNINRAMAVSCFAIAMQAANLFGDHMRHHAFMRVTSIATVIIAVLYLAAMFIVKANAKKNPGQHRPIKFISIFFWVVFALGMTPALYSDVAVSGAPVNMMIFYFLFVAAPVFKKKVFIALYVPLLVFVNVVYALSGADMHMLLSGVMISVCSTVLAYIIQSSNIATLEKLFFAGETDSLTKCFNKDAGSRRMSEQLCECRRKGTSVAVYFIDVDGFKNYNDTFGHLAGDEILVQMISCVKRAFSRELDTITRIGGDEFIIFSPDCTEEDAIDYARNLLDGVAELRIPSGSGAIYENLSISVGLTYVPRGRVECGNGSLDKLINGADKQLYRAKSAGRFCISHSGEIIRSRTQRQKLSDLVSPATSQAPASQTGLNA